MGIEAEAERFARIRMKTLPGSKNFDRDEVNAPNEGEGAGIREHLRRLT